MDGADLDLSWYAVHRITSQRNSARQRCCAARAFVFGLSRRSSPHIIANDRLNLVEIVQDTAATHAIPGERAVIVASASLERAAGNSGDCGYFGVIGKAPLQVGLRDHLA